MDYRLPPDTVRRLSNRRLIRSLALDILILIGVWVALTMRGMDIPMLFLPFLLLFFAVSLFAGSRSARKRLASLTVTLTDDSVGMSLPGLIAPTVIGRDEVARIEERPGQGLAVRTSDRRLVGVSANLAEYEQIRATLATWRPLETIAPSRNTLWTTLAVIGVVGGMLVTYATDDPRVVIPVGGLVIAGLVVSLISIFRSKLLDRRYKLLMLMTLIPLLALIARVIQVATR